MSTKVIVSNFVRLEKKCGERFNEVENAIKDLVKKDKRRSIDTTIVKLDDPAQMKSLNAPAVKDYKSPKQNKNAIDGVYGKLHPDFIMILGASDVVPHQAMRNPKESSQDTDKYAYGDLPYACDAAYGSEPDNFRAPTRGIGRLPDLVADKERGKESLNVDYLKTLLDVASAYVSRKPAEYGAHLGISAWQWRDSTQMSLKNLFGSGEDLQLSPPDGPKWPRRFGRISHFINCHGAQADTRFYGQKGNSFPIALEAKYVDDKTAAGTVIAAECCYGAELDNPSISKGQPGICSTYMGCGAYAFFGSTTIAYGPVSGNGGADLICQYFLKHILDGASVGRAALEARHEFVQTASSNSAWALNPVDLKTLAQFYVLGDPSLCPVEAPVTHSLDGDAMFMKTLSAAATNFPAKRQLRRRQLIQKGVALSNTVAYARKSDRIAPTAKIKQELQQMAAKMKLRDVGVQSYKIKGAAHPKGTPFGSAAALTKAVFKAPVSEPVFHLVEGRTGPKNSLIPASVAIVVQEQAGKIISMQDYQRR